MDSQELRDKVKNELQVYRGWTSDISAREDLERRTDEIMALIESERAAAAKEALEAIERPMIEPYIPNTGAQENGIFSNGERTMALKFEMQIKERIEQLEKKRTLCYAKTMQKIDAIEEGI